MYWFVANGASQKISMKKLPVLSKILKKSMVTIGLALILYHNIKQFTNLKIMTGVLKKRCNLRQNIQKLFRFWHSFPS